VVGGLVVVGDGVVPTGSCDDAVVGVSEGIVVDGELVPPDGDGRGYRRGSVAGPVAGVVGDGLPGVPVLGLSQRVGLSIPNPAEM
jgi:hypothetical protein